jgi:uncharacterized protein (UPF0261 family)
MENNNNKKPTILCMGILDTKGDEIKFLAEEVKRLGADAKILELSLGKEAGWADISLTEVLAENNINKEEVFKVSRSDAINIVGKAGAKKALKLLEKGEIDGAIAWAGSVGTTVSTMVMRALPIGFPKIMMSTLASGDVSSWLGNKDIFIVNPVAEKGLNIATKRIARNCSAAIVAMANVSKTTADEKSKPLAAITAYGTTTPSVMRCADFMENRGWDTIMIHQVGTGATMEDLIRSGQITAVFDLTIGELSNTFYNSIYGISKEWDNERLTAASDVGIPQIVVPGGLDQCAYGPINSVPQSMLDEFKNGKRVSYKNSGTPYIHNSAVTIYCPTVEETIIFSKDIIKKLNKTKGPTLLIIPMRGWSAYDQSAESASVERGWAKENGAGPVWMPDPEKPEWSQRATTMLSVFKKEINKDNPNLDLMAADMHILDVEFTDLLTRCMSDMLDGKWKKGLYRSIKGVIA